MQSRIPLTALILLAASTLACSFTFQLPFDGSDQIERGPMQTRQLRIPTPAEEPVSLKLAFAAGEISLRPGASRDLVEGEARWNVAQLEPEVTSSGNQVVLSSGRAEGFTDFDFNFDFRFDEDTINHWDLALGSAPMDLEIAGGAFQGDIELGGLSLRSLEISSGASELDLAFSEPNQVGMERFDFNTGASSVELRGLANARFERMNFNGGAGGFTLDFSGDLTQDTEVTIDAALSDLEILVPADMNVRLQVEGALADVEVPSGFSRSGGAYLQEGSGPTLTLSVEIGAGQVEVKRP